MNPGFLKMIPRNQCTNALVFQLMGISLLLTATGLGHPGPRVWVHIDSGRIATFTGPFPPTLPSNYHSSRIFTQLLADLGDGVWETDFPGFQKTPGRGIPVGTQFRYNLMGPLLWFDTDDPSRCPYFESVAEHFQDIPPVPQMATTNELFQFRITSSGFVAGDLVFAFNGGDGDHNHLAFTLLGNGTDAVDGPSGVYLLQLQLTGTGFTSSETFYVLFGKNVTPQELAFAADSFVHPRGRPDLDCDGDVDLDDFELLQSCILQPDQPFPPPHPNWRNCPQADFDEGGAVGLKDFAHFQNCFRGSGIPTPAFCDR
jgi:hypothetical protein